MFFLFQDGYFWEFHVSFGGATHLWEKFCKHPINKYMTTWVVELLVWFQGTNAIPPNPKFLTARVPFKVSPQFLQASTTSRSQVIRVSNPTHARILGKITMDIFAPRLIPRKWAPILLNPWICNGETATLPETNSKFASEKWRLGDKPFRLGFGLVSGAIC